MPIRASHEEILKWKLLDQLFEAGRVAGAE